MRTFRVIQDEKKSEMAQGAIEFKVTIHTITRHRNNFLTFNEEIKL